MMWGGLVWFCLRVAAVALVFHFCALFVVWEIHVMVRCRFARRCSLVECRDELLAVDGNQTGKAKHNAAYRNDERSLLPRGDM